MEKIKEANDLATKENYEEAAKILGQLLINHEGANPYQMTRIGELAKYTAEKIAHKISDDGWHSNSKNRESEKPGEKENE